MTAETAVAFPALVLILATAMWGVSAAAAQVACVDAARAGARAAARGEPMSEVRAAARSAAPSGASVWIHRDSRITRVVVRATVSPPVRSLFPPLKLRAQVATATEPEGGTQTSATRG
ncbi:TadE family type IV pilus minor pilin [Actinoallomurus sp. CA-150999]|uniref:TadE family type IV pilus minor pilin n=1 Tax=Actinoallomurus sp. CA-150999 TaxID=3239887 RepID=UPI003D8AED6C